MNSTTTSRRASGTDAVVRQESNNSKSDYEVLLANAADMIRRKPVPAALLAAGVGFIIGRIVS